MDQTLGRIPPQDLQAEQATLGAMMLKPEAVEWVLATGLVDEDFWREEHQLVYEAIQALHKDALDCDPVALAIHLRGLGQLQRAGGEAYLMTLFESVAHAGNAERHAQTVRDRAARRKILTISQVMQTQSYDTTKQISSTIQSAVKNLMEVALVESPDGFTRIAHAIDGELHVIEERQTKGRILVGQPTSLLKLDRVTTGLKPGNLVIIFAQPGRGKSSLICQMLGYLAFDLDVPVGLLSMEMLAGELSQRILTQRGRVDGQDLRTAQVGEDDWRRIVGIAAESVSVPFYVRCGGLDIADLFRLCHQGVENYGMQLLAVDYVQLVRMKGVDDRERVSTASRTLKGLAVDLAVPIVIACQARRSATGKSNYRLGLADMKETSQLEQDADLVISIWDEDYENAPDPHTQREVMLDILKQRMGPTAFLQFGWRPWEQRFVEVDRNAEEA